MLRDDMLAELQGVLNSSSTFTDWAESTLLGYLSEGQDKFCEETGFFIDISNFSITLQTGVAVYAIPDRVIQILDIFDGSRRLAKLAVDEEYLAEDEFGTSTGADPLYWRTDQETGIITFYPTPTSTEDGDTFTLKVWRYSLYDLAGDGAVPELGDTLPAVPELPTRFQRACIEWAAYKAFNHHDIETQDPVKAVDHLNSFKLYVSDGIQAMRRFHGYETRVGTAPAYRT